MRKYFLIFPVILFITLKSFSQADISIDCQDQWGPGRFNKVEVSILFSEEGFARFTQEYPVGFDIAAPVQDGCDINWTGNQLNVVFMDVVPGRETKFSYFIKPETNMNGTFRLQGEAVIISGGETRYIVKLKERAIDIGGSNGILPAEMKGTTLQKDILLRVKTKSPGAISYSAKTIFRVQVAASSKLIAETTIRKEKGLGEDIKISIVKSGIVYKYQAGEYSNFDSAAILLRKLKERGVKGPFIVAFLEGKQVDAEKARRVR